MAGNPNLETRVELRVTIVPGTRNSSLLARFLNSTCGQRDLPQSLHFRLNVLLLFLFLLECLLVLPSPSPWATSGVSSCRLLIQTWSLPPLPQTLPPEAKKQFSKVNLFHPILHGGPCILCHLLIGLLLCVGDKYH